MDETGRREENADVKRFKPGDMVVVWSPGWFENEPSDRNKYVCQVIGCPTDDHVVVDYAIHQMSWGVYTYPIKYVRKATEQDLVPFLLKSILE